MELDEMKSLWSELSKDVEKQKILTDKLITEMIQERYNNQIRKISRPEKVGTVFCVFMALYIMIKFPLLDTWYLQLSGVVAVIYTLMFPYMVLRSLNQMKRIKLAEKSYRELLLDFINAKQRFLRIQKLGFAFNFIFTIIALPLAGKLLNGKDLFLEDKVWYWYLPFMTIVLGVFSWWGLRYYKRVSSKTETIIQELNE